MRKKKNAILRASSYYYILFVRHEDGPPVRTAVLTITDNRGARAAFSNQSATKRVGARFWIAADDEEHAVRSLSGRRCARGGWQGPAGPLRQRRRPHNYRGATADKFPAHNLFYKALIINVIVFPKKKKKYQKLTIAIPVFRILHVENRTRAHAIFDVAHRVRSQAEIIEHFFFHERF